MYARQIFAVVVSRQACRLRGWRLRVEVRVEVRVKVEG